MAHWRLTVWDDDALKTFYYEHRPTEADIAGRLTAWAQSYEDVADTRGDSVHIFWELINPNGDVVDFGDEIVDIEPKHEQLIKEAVGYDSRCCGYKLEDHVWTSEGEGGCNENPGVWSLGGTRLKFSVRCNKCGLRQIVIDPGCQRNPNDVVTAAYVWPTGFTPGESASDLTE